MGNGYPFMYSLSMYISILSTSFFDHVHLLHSLTPIAVVGSTTSSMSASQAFRAHKHFRKMGYIEPSRYDTSSRLNNQFYVGISSISDT